jgi:hypothetical protein
VLQVAQEDIRPGKLIGGFFREKRFLLQHGECLHRGLHAQRRVAAAADQLQRLHDELDLADAARAELDVLGELAARYVAPHLGVQPAHRGERGVVEIFAEDERPDDGVERAVVRSGQRSRFQPRIALPFPALRDEVVLERVEVAGERPGIAVRPQPHVDPEYEAVLRVLREQPDEPAPGALVALLRFRGARVKEDQVHVGRNVELAPAELPHADHDQIVAAQRRLDRHFRELAHRGADLVERREPRQVARHHAQEHAVAQLPQLALERVIARGTERVEHFGARELPRLRELALDLGTRGEHALGEARNGNFLNRIRHLQFRMTLWRAIPP